jgi:hypothetical protein
LECGNRIRGRLARENYFGSLKTIRAEIEARAIDLAGQEKTISCGKLLIGELCVVDCWEQQQQQQQQQQTRHGPASCYYRGDRLNYGCMTVRMYRSFYRSHVCQQICQGSVRRQTVSFWPAPVQSYQDRTSHCYSRARPEHDGQGRLSQVPRPTHTHARTRAAPRLCKDRLWLGLSQRVHTARVIRRVLLIRWSRYNNTDFLRLLLQIRGSIFDNILSKVRRRH